MISDRATASEVLYELKALGDPRARAAMKRFGIRAKDAHGISMPVLHRLARQIRTRHDLAERLWDSGNHEARILAAL